MKKTLFYLFAIMAFWACSKGEDVAPEIILKANTANFTEDGGSSIIYFTSTTAWTAEVINSNNNGWCKVNPESGNAGSSNIVISAEANNTIENRTATVVVKSGAVEKTISVYQDKKGVISFPNNEYTIEGKGGTIEVEVSHNIDFDIEIKDSWITQKQSRALDTDKLIFVVAENETSNYRTGSISLTSKNGNISQQISVKQEGGIFEIHYTSHNEQIVTPNTTYWDGVKILSNTYENSKGIISFNKKISNIGASAFAGCITLKSIEIPNGVTEIRGSAFSECEFLLEVSIPNSVTKIGSYSFYKCYQLQYIDIPASVKEIESCAFYFCEGLQSISIPEGVTAIKELTFEHCRSLKSVYIPQSVTKIEKEAFYDCSSLDEIKIPQDVTYIGRYAFALCPIENITIPDKVTEIGEEVFLSCRNLSSIYLMPTEPPLFKGCELKDNTIIYVPAISLDKYKNSIYWKDYNIQAIP